MTDKELRKLRRTDLIELLLAQSRAADEREAALAEAKKQLESRRIAETEAGSIADAALRLNRVFEAAQAAADQYVENFSDVAERTRSAEEETKKRCEEMERQTRERCQAMEEEAARAEEESRRSCQEREEKTRLHCENMIHEAKTQSQSQWDELKQKMDAYVSGRQELMELFRRSQNAGFEDDGSGNS